MIIFYFSNVFDVMTLDLFPERLSVATSYCPMSMQSLLTNHTVRVGIQGEGGQPN